MQLLNTAPVAPAKIKARVVVGHEGEGRWSFQAFQIGKPDVPFACGNVRATSYASAKRFARMKANAKLPGFVPYAAGGTGF